MPNMDSDALISELIRVYAQAYAAIETVQTAGLLPPGDQKTGVFGEYFAMQVARRRDPKALLAPHASQKGWDIELPTLGKRVQVKAVSRFAKGTTLSPIHPGSWDELWVLALDYDLHPTGFWVVPATARLPKTVTAPNPWTSKKGSWTDEWSENLCAEEFL